ncbi:hypothetical protein IG631_11528 [Alternaria alternata]|nr:hypothetical protein IG631_11528 [Alternaria alternata]
MPGRSTTRFAIGALVDGVVRHDLVFASLTHIVELMLPMLREIRPSASPCFSTFPPRSSRRSLSCLAVSVSASARAFILSIKMDWSFSSEILWEISY